MSDRSSRWRRPLAVALIVAGSLFTIARLAASTTGLGSWRLRLAAAKRLSRVAPDRLPRPLRVLPPPEKEYAGVWTIPPDEARRRLLEHHGFSQLTRAYLHAYERAGEPTYEVASCAYRPTGFFGSNQLHVRLFPRPDGTTDVWCHWECNPNVSPLAHLRQEGYDPARGKERLEGMLDDAFVPADDPGLDATEPDEDADER